VIYVFAIWLALIMLWAYWPQIRSLAIHYHRTWRWRRLKRRIDSIRSDHR
jgi:hypothetical protein